MKTSRILSDYDLFQQMARSAFGDMLYDDERNRAYDSAIKIAVNHLVKSVQPGESRFFHCIDIGTGSGLLSMMIVRAFKELDYDNFHVTACEEFSPMAESAESVIKINNYADKITVYKGSSHELSDESKYDLLVAELLDTELIGEGCLETYRQARELCKPNCIYIPHKARIYLEPVASLQLFKRQGLEDIHIDLSGRKKVNIKMSAEMKQCAGNLDLDELQLTRLKPGIDFDRVTEPKVAFEFDFSNIGEEDMEDSKTISFILKEDIKQPLVVLFWWAIDMYDKSMLTSGCLVDKLDKLLDVIDLAPSFARSESLLERDQMILNRYGRRVWREHWCQAVYQIDSVLRNKMLVGRLKRGDEFKLSAFHDEWSHWFSFSNSGSRSLCVCDVHRKFQSGNILYISDLEVLKTLLESVLHSKPEGIYEGRLEISELDGRRLITFSRTENHHLTDKLVVGLDFARSWSTILLQCFLRGISIEPIVNVKLKFTQVLLKDYSRTNNIPTTVEGFDLTPMRKMVRDASKKADAKVDSRYLWEYQTTRIDPKDYVAFSVDTDGGFEKIMPADFSQPRLFEVPSPTTFGYTKEQLASGWALVFWVDYVLDKTGATISTGPRNVAQVGDDIDWPKQYPQSYAFLHDLAVDESSDSLDKVRLKMVFSLDGRHAIEMDYY